jgi:hypothetical protein
LIVGRVTCVDLCQSTPKQHEKGKNKFFVITQKMKDQEQKTPSKQYQEQTPLQVQEQNTKNAHSTTQNNQYSHYTFIHLK